MTSEQLHILQHSLGVDEYGRGQQYRNHFCAGGNDETVCRELVAAGFMKEHEYSGINPYPTFGVTEAGKAAMRDASPRPPKLTPGKKRYQEWLACADAFPDWNFGDWLKARRNGLL